jgi:CheY-like chemotaxis protein
MIRVALADDHPEVRLALRLLLRLSPEIDLVCVASSGQEALDYLAQSEAPGADPEAFPSPDLIFLDINMPAMNGWEFLDEYTKFEIPPHHKIIMVMLTTSLFPDDLAKSKVRSEVSGFENKPLTIEKLERIIAKHFADRISQQVK